MAIVAARAELPAVQVRMAACALPARLLEDERDVTLAAVDPVVKSAQRIGSPAVIKIERWPERNPTDRSVARGAGEFRGTVRISRATPDFGILCRCLEEAQPHDREARRPDYQSSYRDPLANSDSHVVAP